MNYAITGHEGLIGRYLKNYLDIYANCKLAYDLENGDDIVGMEKIKCDNVDIMFHLASSCKINKIIEDPNLAFYHNTLGTYSVMEFCRRNKINNVVFFSSSRVLSKDKNPYTASKIYGEELVKGYHNSYNMNYIIIRPSTVYAPGIDKTNRLMNIWINNAKNHLDLIINGDENKTLDFTYIDDFINGMKCAIHSGWNKEYNIAGYGETKLTDVAQEIIRQTNSYSNILFDEAEIAQPQQVKIKNEIKGYVPKINYKTGIMRCLE